MHFSLKSKLSLAIALVVLLTVALISLISNYFIQNQFKGYVSDQQKKTTEEIVDRIGIQYDMKTDSWNTDFVHTIGMYALYDGYIVKVYDKKGNTVWDAETCDMRLCSKVMDDVSHRMMQKYPTLNGKFTTESFPVLQNSEQIGTVKISYFGPFFLSKDDFLFLDALNKILIGTGIFALLISVLTGIFLARHLSKPILKTVAAAKNISDGKYDTRIGEPAGTKEVDQLITSINQLAYTLEEQEALRKQMTADVAHELRTPLATVQTHLEAMIEGVWEPTQERLESCYDEMNRLGGIVSDLENLANVESKNLKLYKAPVKLRELAEKALSIYEKECRDKNLTLALEGDCPAIDADRDRISQVLINLMSNAVKYTPTGGKIRISIDEKEGYATFQIEDTGIGIPEEEIPYIFERFYRADKSRNRKTGGSGIGLAIVKSIVSAHGGTIEVKSRRNEGSSFKVNLPINE